MLFFLGIWQARRSSWKYRQHLLRFDQRNFPESRYNPLKLTQWIVVEICLLLCFLHRTRLCAPFWYLRISLQSLWINHPIKVFQNEQKFIILNRNSEINNYIFYISFKSTLTFYVLNVIKINLRKMGLRNNVKGCCCTTNSFFLCVTAVHQMIRHIKLWGNRKKFRSTIVTKRWDAFFYILI